MEIRYYNPEDCTVVPRDLAEKYLKLFSDKERMGAVMDLIRQSYDFGYQAGMDKFCNDITQ